MPYIDPGSGSLLIQVIVAGILAAIFMFRRFWSKTFGIVSKVFGHAKQGKEEKSEDLDS